MKEKIFFFVSRDKRSTTLDLHTPLIMRRERADRVRERKRKKEEEKERKKKKKFSRTSIDYVSVVSVLCKSLREHTKPNSG